MKAARKVSGKGFNLLLYLKPLSSPLSIILTWSAFLAIYTKLTFQNSADRVMNSQVLDEFCHTIKEVTLYKWLVTVLYDSDSLND